VKDEAGSFEALVDQHQRELQVHCYRMTGSVDVAEDLVQETFERAWRGREQFEGRASSRTWLYRIATNACLDHLKRAERRTSAVGTFNDPLESDPGIQPYPDAWLPDAGDPAARIGSKETVELAFVAALQHLPERQRAALIGRDVLGWTAAETAEAMSVSEASANSLVQRGRRHLRRLTPPERRSWRRPSLDAADREVLRRYVDAHERGDAATIVAMLADGIGITMPPEPACLGIAAATDFFETILAADRPNEWRLVLIAANGQPATANYRRPADQAVFRALSVDVLGLVDGEIVTINCFLGEASFAHFGLPLEWQPPSD
jgi:RNA polymerase sigma-70 factor (ECF subfamily)